MQSKLDAAINFLDAGNAFKKADPQGTTHIVTFTLEEIQRSQYVVSVIQTKEFCYALLQLFYTEAISCFCQAIDIYTDMVRKKEVLFKHSNTIQHDTLFWLGIILTNLFPQGRFNIAAKHHIAIAEIYESELLDIDKVSGKRSVYVKVHIYQ